MGGARGWQARLVGPLASGGFAFAAGCALAAFFLRYQYPDFGVFWTAARHAFDPQLYDGAHLTAAQSWWPGMTPHPFVYPPTFLLLVWPFGLLPFTLADYLWDGLSCAALVLAARLVVRPAWAAVIPMLNGSPIAMFGADSRPRSAICIAT